MRAGGILVSNCWASWQPDATGRQQTLSRANCRSQALPLGVTHSLGPPSLTTACATRRLMRWGEPVVLAHSRGVGCTQVVQCLSGGGVGGTELAHSLWHLSTGVVADDDSPQLGFHQHCLFQKANNTQGFLSALQLSMITC